ncbi:cell division protein FtsW, lipid II flippase [Paenibacillus tianmuensis]|uniref:Cell division protein FtsW, lipid II flippase n=1 Tax=Paenibacillus tianmuensis TaxID=624147 RepID=A0A1G4QJI8_9BACL|nr:FtsW/RodA/SpoVE family cell cycle protein [Paenibacillus tianmuensis]SCW44692.1 cell division protein FtsW, lipid II flippase [Paenibacillus tianmuensis]
MIREHEDVRDYLSSVCSQIRARELHKDIRRELESHLEELVLDKEAEGASREEAVAWAIRQMGDPVTVGRELHRIHKPRMHWGLLLGLIAFLGLGVFVMYSIESSYGAMSPYVYGNFFSTNKLRFIALGLPVLLVFYFMDYRKLKTWSLLMYCLAAASMIYVLLFGQQVSGAKSYLSIWRFSIDVKTVSSYLFIAAAAGLLLDWWKQKRYFWLKSIVSFVLVPFVLYAMVPSVSAILFYLVSYGILCGVITRKWWLALLQTGGLLLMCAAVVITISHRYMKYRLGAFLDPFADSSGGGYMYIRMREALSSAGWWGHGFGAVNPKLQFIHEDFIFTYLVYSFGWGVGIAVAGAAVYFVTRMLHSMGQARETYGKMLIVAAASIIGAQFGYCIGMSLGVLPITSVTFPFVSYGGTHTLMEMAIVGLVLGIYRRKDMIRLSKTF